MGSLADALTDLGEVDVHGLEVDGGHHHCRAHTALGADRAEQVSPGVSVITHRTRTRATLGPDAALLHGSGQWRGEPGRRRRMAPPLTSDTILPFKLNQDRRHHIPK